MALKRSATQVGLDDQQSHKKQKLGFLDTKIFPVELWKETMSYLSPLQLFSFSLVNKHLLAVVYSYVYLESKEDVEPTNAESFFINPKLMTNRLSTKSTCRYVEESSWNRFYFTDDMDKVFYWRVTRLQVPKNH